MRQYKDREYRERVQDEFPPAALPDWEGPELAMAKIHDLLEQIKFAQQPPRFDVIDRSVHEALKTLHLLEQFWHGQPPGSYLHELNKYGRQPRREEEYAR